MAGRRHPSGSRLLAILGVVLAAGQLRTRTLFVQVSSSSRLLPAARTPLSHILRFAEGEGDPATTETESEEATEEAPAPESVTPLFQELNVTSSSQSRKLKGAMVAIFNTGDRAADLVLQSPRNRSTMLYAIAEMPHEFRPAAQFLLRQRDRRMRVRVLQHFQPVADDDAEEMRVSKTTNSTKLGSAIMSKFVDVAGNNLKRTVKLEFQGAFTASIAMEAIEKAQHKAHRQFTWTVRKVFNPKDEGGITIKMTIVAT